MHGQNHIKQLLRFEEGSNHIFLLHEKYVMVTGLILDRVRHFFLIRMLRPIQVRGLRLIIAYI